MPVTPNPYIDLSLWTAPVHNEYSNPDAMPQTPAPGNNLGANASYVAPGTPLTPATDEEAAPADPPKLVDRKYYDPYSNTPTQHP